MKKHLLALAWIPVVLGWAGCATPGDETAYRDSSEVERRFQTRRVDPNDYNVVVVRMVESMLNKVLQNEQGGKPLIVLGNVFNNTPHNVRTEMLANKIEVEILRAGTVEFSAATSEARRGGDSGSVFRQLEFQNESGHVDPATMQKYGGIAGAQYVLYGFVENVETRSDRTQAYFSFIMKLHSVRTGKVIWAEESEITKVL